MTMPLLDTTLVRADHIRSFQVCRLRPEGWEVAEQEDGRGVRRQLYTDWHRVERALERFAREIAQLRDQGWSEV